MKLRFYPATQAKWSPKWRLIKAAGPFGAGRQTLTAADAQRAQFALKTGLFFVTLG